MWEVKEEEGEEEEEELGPWEVGMPVSAFQKEAMVGVGRGGCLVIWKGRGCVVWTGRRGLWAWS